MTKAATPCFAPGIPSASPSTITIHTDTVGLRSSALDMYHACSRAEAGSVRACQLLRREHAENIWPSLCWPWMLG